mgnify:CR=1 FL=1
MFGINALKNEVRDLRRELDKKSFNMADYEIMLNKLGLIQAGFISRKYMAPEIFDVVLSVL